MASPRIFIDTDVLLDVLLERQSFVEDSAAILDWAEQHPGRASVSWHGLANLHYLSEEGAEEFLRELLQFCVVPSVGTTQLIQALDLSFADLEDAMQVTSAIQFGAQWIVSRNVKDYRKSPLQVLSPRDMRKVLGVGN